MNGEGVLVMPDPAVDVRGLGLSPSLHASGWDAVVRHLDGLGWEPCEDDEQGGWLHVGLTTDGLDVLALFGRDPIVSRPSLEECMESVRDLAGMAGMEAPR